MAAILESRGLSRLKTCEMKVAVSSVICKIQMELPDQYRLSLDCKSYRNQLIAALISEIGFSKELQVSKGTERFWNYF